MRDNVFDVPIGLLRELVAMPSSVVAGNGRRMYVGVKLREDVRGLLRENDALVGRYLVVSSYAVFGHERYGSVMCVGPVAYASLADALDWMDYNYAEDMACLCPSAFNSVCGYDYEVWHIVADPVTAPVAAVDAVPGVSRAASASAVLGALPGEHDGVFDVTLDQFETWADQAAHLSDSAALTWYPDRDEWVYRSRGLCVSRDDRPARVGDWYRVYTSAAFDSPALDVWATRIPDDAVGPVLRARDNSYCNELFGLGYEVEYWHIVGYLPRWNPYYDPRLDPDSELFDYDLYLDENGYWDPPAPEHMARIYAGIEKMRSSVDDHYWDERPEPQPVDTWYEIDLFGPEVV